MYLWAKKKGINLLSVADFTHPLWFSEIQKNLTEVQEGVYSFSGSARVAKTHRDFFRDRSEFLGPYFLLTTEISLIYSQEEKVHRIHVLVFAPNLTVVSKINKLFQQRDFTLGSDGRPTFGISAMELCEMLFSLDERIEIVPCHIWTPWFSLFGSKSGFDTVTECFGKYSKRLFAVETGLSSDPSMNWRIPQLDDLSIVSFGDAHSFYKLGREATVLVRKDQSEFREEEITYHNVVEGLRPNGNGPFFISHTIEFYPEEGKYHFDGLRSSNVCFSPEESRKYKFLDPKSGKALTLGVMHRVDDLAKRDEKNFVIRKDTCGVKWVHDKKNIRRPYVSLVPLQEVISEVVQKGVNTKTVLRMYDHVISMCGSEFDVLLRVCLQQLESVGGRRFADAIGRLRSRDIVVSPGYDGVFGTVSIWGNDEEAEDSSRSQMNLKF